MKAGLWSLTAAIGLVLVVVAGLGVLRKPAVAGNFGTTSAPAAVATPRTVPHRTAPDPTGSRPASRRPPPAPSRPVRLSMPTLGARATVVPVARAGPNLDVPGDPAQAGWWTASALAGSAAGSVIIDGHVDSAATGPGALFRLTRLRAGDPIAITTAAGSRLTYTVTGRRVYAKSRGLPASLFAATGVPRLVLITCGGPFDRSTFSYQDNIAVFASPLPDSSIGRTHHP